MKDYAINGVVYLVEDDKNILEALITLFESVQIQVHSFLDGNLFLEHYQAHKLNKICCIILDVRLPIISGLELFHNLRNHNENHPIIFISAHGTISMAVEMVKKGAFDFISKPFNNQYLLDTVQKAFLDRASLQPLEEFKQKLQHLSLREHEVLNLLLKANTVKEIAFQLNISISTAEVHQTNILKKLNMVNLIEILPYYSYLNLA